jgi:hypothetical protein
MEETIHRQNGKIDSAMQHTVIMELCLMHTKNKIVSMARMIGNVYDATFLGLSGA